MSNCRGGTKKTNENPIEVNGMIKRELKGNFCWKVGIFFFFFRLKTNQSGKGKWKFTFQTK